MNIPDYFNADVRIGGQGLTHVMEGDNAFYCDDSRDYNNLRRGVCHKSSIKDVTCWKCLYYILQEHSLALGSQLTLRHKVTKQRIRKELILSVADYESEETFGFSQGQEGKEWLEAPDLEKGTGLDPLTRSFDYEVIREGDLYVIDAEEGSYTIRTTLEKYAEDRLADKKLREKAGSIESIIHRTPKGEILNL